VAEENVFSVGVNLQPSAAASHYALHVIRAIRMRLVPYIGLGKRVALFPACFERLEINGLIF
jgi:hypothetical protein